jgi:hypothetical protein
MPPINHITHPVILVENNHKPRLLPLLVLNLVQCQRHWRANHPSDILLISKSRNWIWFTGTRPSTICKHIKMFSESSPPRTFLLLPKQHDTKEQHCTVYTKTMMLTGARMTDHLPYTLGISLHLTTIKYIGFTSLSLTTKPANAKEGQLAACHILTLFSEVQVVQKVLPLLS